MATYQVRLKTGAFAYVTVEAEDEVTAIEAAFDESPSICAQCSGWGREFSLEIGEWDLDDGDEEWPAVQVEE